MPTVACTPNENRYLVDVNFTININFPALDRLVTLVESNLQDKIDAILKQSLANAAKVKATVDQFTPPTQP